MIKRIQKYIYILLNIVSYSLLFHDLENRKQPEAAGILRINKPGYKTRM